MKQRLMVLSVLAMLLLLSAGLASTGEAGVSIGVGINLPLYRFAAPPALVVVPGTYVYAVPDIDVEVLFYGGLWYRPYEGAWFSARSYRGPWVAVAPVRVPSALLQLPPDYRAFPPDWRRIPYRELNKNWRRWERDKYWERNERWREHGRVEHREERREDRREDPRERHEHGRP